jgi:8-oxo-dGTP pyrophosphatase MutT (NUDIX family)
MEEPQAAVAILHAGRPEESVLLIRRAEREGDAWSGHWSFPGGLRDARDPDLVHTALRELQEECGIALDRRYLETALAPMVARRSMGPYLLVAPFVFRVDSRAATALDPREVADSLWVPLDVLLDPARHRLRCVPGRPQQVCFPAIDLHGTPLWGFTYRLITDWLALLPQDEPIEQAGFRTASLILEFLVSNGLALQHGWTEPGAAPGKLPHSARQVAAVEGCIPANAVLEQFSASHPFVPTINFLEACPEYVRVAGLAFEEYWIVATGPAR